MVDEKWFIRKGCFWGLHAGRQEMLHPENLPGYSFIIREKWEQEEDHLFPHSWVDVMPASSAPPPGWAGEFSYPCMVKLGLQIFAV